MNPLCNESLDGFILLRACAVEVGEILGVSPAMIYTRLKKSKTVAQALDEARNATLDRAESKLFEAVEHGEQWAIQFVLKTLGKSQRLYGADRDCGNRSTADRRNAAEGGP